MRKIREIVQNKKISVSDDETTDSEGHFVANVAIGILFHKLAKPILLTTKELQIVDHSSIADLFSNSLKLLGSNC